MIDNFEVLQDLCKKVGVKYETTIWSVEQFIDFSRKCYEQGRADALDIDMDEPMHFTDKQKAWIKNYIIINAKRQRADAIDEIINSIKKDQYCSSCPYKRALCGQDCKVDDQIKDIMINMLEYIKEG